jgi:hypothetical protein
MAYDETKVVNVKALKDTATRIKTEYLAAISKAGHARFQKSDTVPDAGTAEENVLYLVHNDETGHYDVYALIDGVVELLDDTTVDLSNYVQKDGDKVLSDNNFSDADKTKLDGIAEGANNYTHPSHTAAASGFYKVTVDELGHVTAVTAVTKEDITGLGIPGQDTTYQKATAEADGLMSKEHFSKVEGVAAGATKVEASTTVGNIKINGTETPVVTIATDGEVAEMLAEVFPTT